MAARPQLDQRKGEFVPKRPGVKRLDHVSIATSDAKQTLAFLSRLLGAEIACPIAEEGEGYRGAYLYFADSQARVEVLEPCDAQSFLSKFIAERGPGVHHITFEVDDVEETAAFLKEEMGIEPYRGVWSDHEWKQTFVHPKDTGGVLLQFYEWLPGKRPDNAPKIEEI